MKKETLTVRFLYGTKVGRSVLKLLVHPSISKLGGKVLETSLSRWIVPGFVKKYQIDLSGYEQRKYVSFNDFFTRKRIKNEMQLDAKTLMSPCDGYLSVYQIDKDQNYHIKNVEYNIQTLLQDGELAKKYMEGLCLIFRLTPQDYHRYCYICDGHISKTEYIPGQLHCVRPIAYTSRPVFVENSRAYTVIQSEQLGSVVQMEVGALMVGKIHNHNHAEEVFKGQEKGYFEFGGSTIIVLIEKERVEIFNEIMENTRAGKETRVRLGDVVGTLV